MMRIGIFFGGPSREREISFAGGRTVYDNLNKDLFAPVPVFVDSLGNFILLDWQYVYKGTIRDFYPPVAALRRRDHGPFQIYIESLLPLSQAEQDEAISAIGRRIEPREFKDYFDFAFLCLHGPYGEDGNLQGLLEWYGLPYSGSGILPSAIGISKLAQRDLMQGLGFRRPQSLSFSKERWKTVNRATLLSQTAQTLGLPFVVKAPTQGSSIGVTVVGQSDIAVFERAVNRAFFLEEIDRQTWDAKSKEESIRFIRQLVDIREGIGLPVYVHANEGVAAQMVWHPVELLEILNSPDWSGKLLLESPEGEEVILFESFIKGREFSCIVVEDEEGQPIALPPTEIIKTTQVFDYRSKYLPGMSRKQTPIDLPATQVDAIRKECADLYRKLQFSVYARIDGFINEAGHIYLNDPNTTSGMLPSSFFFHQAAEIGLNPSQFLTFIIRTSLAARLREGKKLPQLKDRLVSLDEQIAHYQNAISQKIKVGVIMGGYSSERHISVESGRNIYEKLSSSSKYEPVPLFLTGEDHKHELYWMPLPVMLKDNADDIKEKVTARYKANPVLDQIREEAESITGKYAGEVSFRPQEWSYKELSNQVQAVFIALHGRPGEDGQVQERLDKYNIPYNGSGTRSSQITINKYETNEILAANGLLVARHELVWEKDWKSNAQAVLDGIESRFSYPFICKPGDDGCSSAVKKIKNRAELESFCNLIFREYLNLNATDAQVLGLKINEEFPHKAWFMVEDLITDQGAARFLEITGGMLTHWGENGERIFEVFEPSEALASGEVLSLEEKFLAGEGQNITPPRYAADTSEQARISAEVKAVLKRAAELCEVEGYCRIDAFVRIYPDGRVETVIIEINSLPGMTPATAIFHQCALAGYKPYDFIDAILDYGTGRRNRKLQLA